jgi:Spy/CpxP family protein refolding chaperone
MTAEVTRTLSMNIQRRFLIALGLALTTWATSPALADPAASRSSEASERRGFKRVRGEILRKTLGLDEKNAAAVEQVLDRFAPERKSLRRGIEEQQLALSELLKKDSADQAAYKRALDTLASHQAKLNALRQAEQVELGKLMSPKQQAQLLAVMAKTRNAKRKD